MHAPTKPRAAVLQLTSGSVVEDNLAALERTAEGAASEGAKLIVAPEGFAFLGPEQERLRMAEPLPEGGPVLTRCRALAQALDAELVLGGFWERAKGDSHRIYNACVHVLSDGSVGAIYRKIHLFDVDLADGSHHRESASVARGAETVTSDTRLGRLGLSVCYDVRFPELYRRLVDEGATLLAVPSAFTPTTGKDHWHVLLRARAIESQAYVLAAAQCGTNDSGRSFYGHALIVDPWGVVRSECADSEGWAIATIDPAWTTEVRRRVPSLAHRVIR